MLIDQWRKDTERLATVRDFIRFGASRMAESDVFFGHGTDNAWDEAVFIVTESLSLPWQLLEQIMDSVLADSESEQILSVFSRRVEERIPAAYLLGKAWFAGLPFVVNENVLIPRSPIAEMIGADFAPWLPRTPERILDLCCGGGCIGIATASRFPDALVDLSDISPEAIDVAWTNIDLHGLQDRVQAVESDLFHSLDGDAYDLIVCNPPYVDENDLADMPTEFHFEPALGLGSGTDGLDFTRRLLAEAADYLSDDGVLICELGNSWPALEDAYPGFEFSWVDFEHGGHGVFAITRDELIELADSLQ